RRAAPCARRHRSGGRSGTGSGRRAVAGRPVTRWVDADGRVRPAARRERAGRPQAPRPGHVGRRTAGARPGRRPRAARIPPSTSGARRPDVTRRAGIRRGKYPRRMADTAWVAFGAAIAGATFGGAVTAVAAYAFGGSDKRHEARTRIYLDLLPEFRRTM